MGLLLGKMRFSHVPHGAKSGFRKKMAMLAVATVILGSAGYLLKGSAQRFFAAKSLTNETPLSVLDGFYDINTQTYDELKPGENLFLALKRLNVSDVDANLVVKSLATKINLKKIAPKTKISIISASNTMQLSTLSQSLDTKSVELFMKDEFGIIYSLKAEILTDANQAPFVQIAESRPTVIKKTSMLAGIVESSLYSSMMASGADASLVNDFSGIFGWQIDFYREAKRGDFFKMVVEKNYVEGRFVGFGSVIAAEYLTGLKKLRGFRFSSADGKVKGFFDEKGQSLKNAFLKAPLKLASIGSKFGMRFHPVLKVHRPHNGVDYGAARGTPFMAVAAGVVKEAGFSRFNGNYAKITHMNGYETEYLHAHKLANGIKKGARVSQGQVIGYVGSTGLATGPHLHFGMRKNGGYINPAKQIFDRSPGVPKTHIREFAAGINPMVIAFNQPLDAQPSALAQGEDAAQKLQ